MMSPGARTILLALSGAAVLLGGGAAWFWFRYARPIPDRFESFGPFDVVTHTHRYWTGYNEGNIHQSTTESYSLRYRGEPFSFVGRAGMFGDDTQTYRGSNAIITFPTSTPAVLLNVGDPNNTSFFYLIREAQQDGHAPAVADFVCESNGGVSADWLDGDPTAIRDLAVHRRHLEGGRLILLAQRTVLDTRSLTWTTCPLPSGVHLNGFKPPLALSPSRHSFVRYGSDDENRPVLCVMHIPSGSAYVVPIDRRIMRYNSWEELDATWVDHYWEWKNLGPDTDAGEPTAVQPPDGEPPAAQPPTGEPPAAQPTAAEPDAALDERLVVREHVVPLPYHGSVWREPYSSYREYRVLPVDPAMLDVVIGFLRDDLSATPAPEENGGGSFAFRIGEQLVHVAYYDDHVGLWMDHGVDAELVEEIARRFDELLATGRYDEMFREE